DPRQTASLALEARAVARLNHPNVVRLHVAGGQAGRAFLVMELVEGGDLTRRLGGRPLPPAEAAALVGTLARAIHHAHARGIDHRDLNPSNVLLAGDGTPKITDFGLARDLSGPAGQTPSGAVLGTPAYMAPEQAAGKGKTVGAAADVYGLGAILYECLTGRLP